jgi:membrane-associated protease RseP (regulator of RpoE activity)
MMSWLLAALLVPNSWAGDPCPISLDFHEYTPSWRDRAADLQALSTKRPWYGLHYGAQKGQAVVFEAIPSSPAHAAGLQTDDVITAFQGTPLRDPSHLDTLFDAHTGDEIVFTIQRGEATKDITVRRGLGDPVFLGALRAAQSTGCREARIRILDDAQQAAITTHAFDAQRGFRCEDAHTRLASSFEHGDLIMVRGGRRILVTMPHWATTCIDVASVDGAALTGAALTKLLETVAGAYVQDRHDNP